MIRGACGGLRRRLRRQACQKKRITRNVTIVSSPCHSKSGRAVINEGSSDTFITDISIDLNIAKVGLKEQRHRCKQGRGRGPYPGYDIVGTERIDNATTREDVRCLGKAWDTNGKKY